MYVQPHTKNTDAPMFNYAFVDYSDSRPIVVLVCRNTRPQKKLASHDDNAGQELKTEDRFDFSFDLTAHGRSPMTWFDDNYLR